MTIQSHNLKTFQIVTEHYKKKTMTTEIYYFKDGVNISNDYLFDNAFKVLLFTFLLNQITVMRIIKLDLFPVPVRYR